MTILSEIFIIIYNFVVIVQKIGIKLENSLELLLKQIHKLILFKVLKLFNNLHIRTILSNKIKKYIMQI